MNYGRLILDSTAQIDLIAEIKRNEKLNNKYKVVVKSLNVKVLADDSDYTINDKKVTVLIDNADSESNTNIEIAYETPLSMPCARLTECQIKGTAKRVLVDYAY